MTTRRQFFKVTTAVVTVFVFPEPSTIQLSAYSKMFNVTRQRIMPYQKSLIQAFENRLPIIYQYGSAMGKTIFLTKHVN